MFKKNYKYLIAVFILLSCSSCFQLVEEINLNDNGTGNVNLTMNLSSSRTKVASLMLLDSVQGYKVPSKQTIQKNLDEVVAYLKNSPGLTNVKRTIDFENYIVNLSFSFKNISNINNLNQNILNKFKVRVVSNSSYSYDPEKHIFQRSYQHTPSAIAAYNKLKPAVRDIFKEATYTSIYRFEKPVTSSSNSMAKISKSKKAVMINTGILNLINGKTNVSNKIILAN